MIAKKASRFSNTAIVPMSIPQKADSAYFFPKKVQMPSDSNSFLTQIPESIDKGGTIGAKMRKKLPMILDLRQKLLKKIIGDKRDA